MGHLAALQEHVVDAASAEVVAHGEPGLTRADDHDGHGAGGTALSMAKAVAHCTRTATLVGLVRAS